MRLPHATLAASVLAAVLVCGFGNPITHSLNVPVIVTAAPSYDAVAALRGEERFAHGAQLLLVNDGKSEPLVSGFAASADADVSFDATKVLFAGKKNVGGPWAIWELTLTDRSIRKVIGGDSDVVRPLYLPGNRLVYARRAPHGFRLEAAQLDGSGMLVLSHVQASALPLGVLEDGRILFESVYPLGAGTTPEMYLVYSDGSGVESYRCDHGAARWGGKQLRSGDVVFTHGTTLARFASPLAAESPIVAPKAEYAGGVVEIRSGEWLVSARRPGETHYSLTLWAPGTPVLQSILRNGSEDIVEPAPIAERLRPHRHPSALHDWDYANLLALDARESREGNLSASPAAVRLETIDADGNSIVLGSAPVDPDGSFFVKAPGDRPIRFSLLGAGGEVLRQEHGWFWIRKGEQRICVGCHTGPERAAENRVPAVLLRTTTPADLSGNEQPATVGNR